MSNGKMSDFIKNMNMVQEKGLRKDKSSSGDTRKTTKLFSEGNTMKNAVSSYERMCGITNSLNESVSEPKANTIDESIKMMGALQAIKELIEEGEGIKRDVVLQKITSIKKIIQSL